MTIAERLRMEADEDQCVPLTPLLNAAADHIERLEDQLGSLRRLKYPEPPQGQTLPNISWDSRKRAPKK